ncbi:MAG: ARMT1-like domain-containing protein [Victivallaceae bacterium]|nr:ARMT1-like domain-containing protein [Victivallaceae bacterium]
MKITFDCIPCLIGHAVHIAKMVSEDDNVRYEIIRKTLAETGELDLTLSPPEQAGLIHRVIRAASGVDDPYLTEKDNSTAFALKLLPAVREKIEAAPDRFEAIVRLVIAGNIIDYGAIRDFKLADARKRIFEVFDMPIDREAVRLLKKRMDEAETIFYIADNCGEAVFDRLLIELYRDKITLGVRGGAILNDLTPRELKASGLDFVPYVHTGDVTPGVSMRYSSKKFLDEMRRADLVVAKGQGNYETMNEYGRPIFFLLRVKCRIIADLIGNVNLGDLLVIPKNL